MKKIMILVIMGFAFLSICNTTYAYDVKDSLENEQIISNNTFEGIDEATYFEVKFDTNGGFYTYNSNNYYTIPSQRIAEGELIVEPTIIKRHGYIFEYWSLEDGTEWDFTNDQIYSNISLTAIWRYNVNRAIISPDNHIYSAFPGSTNWVISNSNSIKNVRGSNPVEIGSANSGSSLNYDDELAVAIQLSRVSSTYGGCGPIALIGILDYFSRTAGYRSLLSDPNDFHERVRLANLTLQNTITYEIGLRGNKNTFTWPGDYMRAFDTMISMGNLDSQLSVKQYGALSSKYTKHAQIKNSIDRGIPVTAWTFSQTGDGLYQDYISYHYFNLYGYIDYEGLDSTGNTIIKTLYKARMNWGNDYVEYVDADAFDQLWGIFVYNEVYQPQLIQPIDYDYSSQYYFSETQQSVTLLNSNQFSFSTNRLRTGYVWSYKNDIPDLKYLVLSAKRLNAGTAFLEYQFPVSIKALNFDISLWSGNEGLSWINDSVRLEYKDSDGNWILAKEFYNNKYKELSTIRTIPDNHYISFETSAYEIRFIVECTTPSGSRNYGRVVIGDMVVLY